MSTIVWFCLAFLAYTFVGYPVLAWALSRFRPIPISKAKLSAPPSGSISVLIAFHNEAARVTDRLQNLLDTDFAPNRLEVIAVSDGSADNTAETIRAVAQSDARIKPLILEKRSGKPASLNSASASATGDFLVFADARQRFHRDTIPHLIANFQDPNVGAVSGELHIATSDTGAGAGVDLYWRLEKMTRAAESRAGSAIGCTGAVYAVRSDLLEPLPEDTLVDDVVIPMKIIQRGFRVVFDPLATALDPQQLDPTRESRRKTRTLAGNFQMLFRYPRWLVPWHSHTWWRLASHKYARLLAPIFLITAVVSSAILAFGEPPSPSMMILFGAQVALYTLAILGLCFPKKRWRILTIPSAFLFLNLMVIRGFFYYLKLQRDQRPGW